MTNLSDLVDADLVAFKPQISNQDGVFELIASMLANKTGADAGLISNAFAEREALGTTGFGNGTAIPHGRLPGIDRLYGAVVRLPKAVEWHSVDGLPVDLVFALVGPVDAGAQHLKALALVSRTLRDKLLVEKLRGAADAGAIWALMGGREKQAA